ncbi:cilia- and flagella-associated protein 69-like [Gigantopelta aegis]|uniref:cilia- and flagella-associated protein 69-like n=1 Tax=Gigantopelta aegis TaxID=1735272 RepID=UPI001B88ABAE|nr:cilia- and flagella-associated protein 69-like [Gigantopelta aegis]
MAAMQTQTQPVPVTGLPSRDGISETKKIPLVGHIITDDDLGILQGTVLKPVNLNRVIKLLTDQHSAMLYDRHCNVLKKLVRRYEKGFLMKELVQVFKLLNICADRVEEQPLYEQPIIELLMICSLPFLKEKSSDEMVYEQIVVESVSQLGYLMRVPSSDVRKQICKTLYCFYTEAPQNQIVQKHKAMTVAYNQMIVENSDISETLVKSLALLDSDLDVKQEVLKVLQRFSKNSPKNCDQMLRADGAKHICYRFMDPDPSGEVLFRSVDIIWNLMEHGDTAQIAQQLNNLTCISQIRDAFLFELGQGFSHYDRQLRNDLLVIATLIAAKCPGTPFIETGFSKQLVVFATFQEVKSHNVLVKHLKLSTNHEDFEMKKLLFSLLVALSNDSSVIPILSEGHLLLALFSYVRANDETPGVREWTHAQFEEIQLHAMSCLCTLCPLMMEDYMTCQGSTRLLLLLEWCVGPDDFKGHGNSFHGSGGRGSKKAQMRHCLRLMRRIVSTDDSVALQDLADQGAINQLIGILTTAFGEKRMDDGVDIEMQSDILFILSSLCDGDMHRKELFGNQGVDIVVQYLQMDTKLLNSGLGHHRLLLAAIDCAWCAIVGCYMTEDYFLEREGVFLLIDLLEVCPKNMHNLIVGCLLDLCENTKTVNHVLTWQGKDNSTAAHLFCEIWRNEEREIGARRDELGSIIDARHPLMGRMQEELGVISLPAKYKSQAIVDVLENMRAKIYSIFCKIGFAELPGLDVADHVTLTMIEKYLDFKIGEVWTETINELEMEHIRPVSPDLEALEAISRAVEERAQIVGGTQIELLEAQRNQDILDEQEFYAEIRENHRQKEKALIDFTDFVTRTSNFIILKAAKNRQEIAIDASRIQTKYRDKQNFHNTDIPGLHTTVFSGKNVDIDSTPHKLITQLLDGTNVEQVQRKCIIPKHLTM